MPSLTLTPQLIRAVAREHERRKHDWEGRIARPNQLVPPGDWGKWLILAGRGFGKTRTGAETVRQWHRGLRYVNLIGPTADAIRDIMVEGESGILAICPKDERPIYRPSKRRLEWPNGCRSLLFSADEPERLRGPQHEALWCDEICAWSYPESWDQAVFGLRLGPHPRAVLTTTPKPGPLVRSLLNDPDCHVTRGSTYDNRANLAASFFSNLITKYEGTRLGRQELVGDVLNDIVGALWLESTCLAARGVVNKGECARIVIGVDPAGGGDLIGINVAGNLPDGRYGVLEDASCDSSSPATWAKLVVGLYHAYMADAVVVETNFGGNMVEALIQTEDANVRVIPVVASRGKHIRAEPIAALYEQGKVTHNGPMLQLEKEMQDMAISGWCGDGSPNRLDAMVWALTALSEKTPQPAIDMKTLKGKPKAIL